MEEDILRCGNDLRWLEWWLHHRLQFDGELVKDLASVTQSLVQVLASGQISNQSLARELKSESAKALVSAVNRLASSATAKAAA
jgi:hypothetical protein